MTQEIAVSEIFVLNVKMTRHTRICCPRQHAENVQDTTVDSLYRLECTLVDLYRLKCRASSRKFRACRPRRLSPEASHLLIRKVSARLPARQVLRKPNVSYKMVQDAKLTFDISDSFAAGGPPQPPTSFAPGYPSAGPPQPQFPGMQPQVPDSGAAPPRLNAFAPPAGRTAECPPHASHLFRCSATSL